MPNGVENNNGNNGVGNNNGNNGVGNNNSKNREAAFLAMMGQHGSKKNVEHMLRKFYGRRKDLKTEDLWLITLEDIENASVSELEALLKRDEYIKKTVPYGSMFYEELFGWISYRKDDIPFIEKAIKEKKDPRGSFYDVLRRIRNGELEVEDEEGDGVSAIGGPELRRAWDYYKHTENPSLNVGEAIVLQAPVLKALKKRLNKSGGRRSSKRTKTRRLRKQTRRH